MTFVNYFHHDWSVVMPDFGNSFANNKGTMVINIKSADTIKISGVGIISGLPSIVALIPHLSATVAPMIGPGIMVKAT